MFAIILFNPLSKHIIVLSSEKEELKFDSSSWFPLYALVRKIGYTLDNY